MLTSNRQILWVVAAALVDEQGRVLVQQRPPGKSMAGLWEFPGGKVDPGELPEAALVRELEEELGVSVERDALVPVGFASEPIDTRHLLMLLYSCRSWCGEPTARHATNVSWCRPDALRGLDMPPADRPLIASLEVSISGRP